jgi:hypothetical protein
LFSFSAYIPYSMLVLLFMFLWKISYYFDVFTFIHYFFFSFSLFAFNILVLLSMLIFHYNIPWRGSVLVMSVYYSRGFLYLDGQLFLEMWSFLLLFCWIYFLCLLLTLLWGPWLAGLVFWWSCRVFAYSFHSSSVFSQSVLLFFSL